MNPRSVLFDLDGTLTDPFEGITNCVLYALERAGRPLPLAEDLRWVIGPPLLGSLETLLGDSDAAAEGLRTYRERFSTVGLFENRVYPGIPELLTKLKEDGDRLFVATSKPTVYSKRIVDEYGLTGYFEGVYGSELDGTRTDKSHLIKHILESEKMREGHTVMIGDRRHDIDGAKNNGLQSIGVLYGYGTREELVQAGPDALAECPDDIIGCLADLKKVNP